MKLFKTVLAVAIGILLLLFLLLFIKGAFEICPAAEQIEKGRIVCALIMLVLGVSEIILFKDIRRR